MITGEEINKEYVFNYYDLYSKTFQYNEQMLHDVLRAFRHSVQIDDWKKNMKQLAPWYYRAWFRIEYWFNSIGYWIVKRLKGQ